MERTYLAIVFGFICIFLAIEAWLILNDLSFLIFLNRYRLNIESLLSGNTSTEAFILVLVIMAKIGLLAYLKFEPRL